MNEGGELEKVKIESQFDSLLDVGFNENCMNEQKRYEECSRLLLHSKFLRMNGFEVYETLKANKRFYISPNFSYSSFMQVMNLLKYALEKYFHFAEALDSRLEIIKAEVWQYFLSQREKSLKEFSMSSDDEETPNKDIIEDPLELWSRMKKRFQSVKEEFRNFVIKEQIKGVVDDRQIINIIDLHELLSQHDLEPIKRPSPGAVDEEDDLSENVKKLLKRMKL